MTLDTQQRQKIVDYFRRRPEVAGVYLYGSQQRRNPGPLSDVDIAVLMGNEVAKEDVLDFQLDYINEIQSILKVDLAADVKILSKDDALIYHASVINNGTLIVNNRPEIVDQFVHKIGMLYPDFYPVLQKYYSEMNQRLEEGTYAT